jgi:hypothetical protein
MVAGQNSQPSAITQAGLLESGQLITTCMSVAPTLLTKQSYRNFPAFDPSAAEQVDNTSSEGFRDIDDGKPIFDFDRADDVGVDLHLVSDCAHKITRPDTCLMSSADVHPCHTGLPLSTLAGRPCRPTFGPGGYVAGSVVIATGLPDRPAEFRLSGRQPRNLLFRTIPTLRPNQQFDRGCCHIGR